MDHKAYWLWFLNRDEPPTAIKFTVLSVKRPGHRYFIEKTE